MLEKEEKIVNGFRLITLPNYAKVLIIKTGQYPLVIVLHSPFNDSGCCEKVIVFQLTLPEGRGQLYS